MKNSLIALFLLLKIGSLTAAETAEVFSSVALTPIHGLIQVPDGWSVFDKSSSAGGGSWIISPDNLNMGPYQTGVRVDVLSHVSKKFGVIASEWVADRIQNKSTSLPIVSSDAESTNDYFRMKKLLTQEVYSPGGTDYTTYRTIYSWFWNDEHDVVICMEARTPEKYYGALFATLEKIGDLKFDETEWKKELEETEE